MSGDVIRLLGVRGGFLARAVADLALLPAGPANWAVVGGIAAMIVAGESYRATQDVDVFARDAQDILEMLIDADVLAERDPLTFAGGVPFDLVDVAAGDGDLPAARRWALDNARHRTVEVVTEDGKLLSVSTPRVASPAGLIVLKLHSATSNRRADHKKGADIFDICQLSRACYREIASELRTLPESLRVTTMAQAQRLLVDNASDSYHHFAPGYRQEVTKAQLPVIGADLIATLADGNGG